MDEDISGGEKKTPRGNGGRGGQNGNGNNATDGIARIRASNRRRPFSEPSDIYPVCLRKDNFRPQGGVEDASEPQENPDAVQNNIYRGDLWITVPLDLLQKNASGFADMHDGGRLHLTQYIQSIIFMLTATMRMNVLRRGSVSIYIELMVANDFNILRERQDQAGIGDANALDRQIKLQLFNPSNILGYRFRVVLHSNASSASTIVHRQIFYNQEEVGLIKRKTLDAKLLLLVSDLETRRAKIRERAKETICKKNGVDKDAEESDELKMQIDAEAAKVERQVNNIKPVPQSRRDQLEENIQTGDSRLCYRSILNNVDYIKLVRSQDRLAGKEMPADANYQLTHAQLNNESFEYHTYLPTNPRRAWNWEHSTLIMKNNCSGIKACPAQRLSNSYYMSDAHGNNNVLAFPFPHLVWRLDIDQYDIVTLFNTRFPWYLSMLADRVFAIQQVIQAHYTRKEREHLAAAAAAASKPPASNAAAAAAEASAAAQIKPMDADNKMERANAEMRSNPQMFVTRNQARLLEDDEALGVERHEADGISASFSVKVPMKEDRVDGVLLPQYFLDSVTANFDAKNIDTNLQQQVDSGLSVAFSEQSSSVHQYVEGEITKLSRRHLRQFAEIKDLVAQYPCETLLPGGASYRQMSEQEAFYERYDLLRELQELHSIEAIHEMIQLITSNGVDCSELHVNSLREWYTKPTESFVEMVPCEYPALTMYANYRIGALKKYVHIGATNPLLYLNLLTAFKNMMSSNPNTRLSHNIAVISERGQGKSHMMQIMGKSMVGGAVRPMDAKSKLSDAVATAQGNHVRAVDEMMPELGDQSHKGMEKHEDGRRMIKAALTQQQVNYSRNVRDDITGKHKMESKSVQCLHGMIVVGNYWRLSKGVDTSLPDRFHIDFLVNWRQRTVSGLARRALPLNKMENDLHLSKVTQATMRDNVISCLLITMLDLTAIVQVDLTVFQVQMLKALDAISPWMPSADNRIRMVQRAENEAWSETINYAQYVMLNSEVSPHARNPEKLGDEYERKKPLPLLENFPSIFAPALWCRWDIGLHAVTKYMQEFYPMRWHELLRLLAARMGAFYPQFFESSYRNAGILLPDIETRARQRMENPNAPRVEYPDFIEEWQRFADSRDAEVFTKWENSGASARAGAICVPLMPKCEMAPMRVYAQTEKSVVNGRNGSSSNSKESAKTSSNMENGTFYYNPNFIQIKGSLYDVCGRLASCISDVFQTDAEVLVSLFEHMQTRTIEVPRYKLGAFGDPSSLEFEYTSQPDGGAMKKVVIYDTVPLVQEIAGDASGAEGERGRSVRIATGALMVPQPHLLFLMLTEAENKFTTPMSTVLPLEVPHYDSMMERFDVRPRRDITLKVSNPHFYTGKTSTNAAATAEELFNDDLARQKSGVQSAAVYEEMRSAKDRRPCISSLLDEQINSSPLIQFSEQDIQKEVFYRHLRQCCMMPNLTWIAQLYNDFTKDYNSQFPDPADHRPLPYPNPAHLSEEEKRALWYLYPQRDMQYPGQAETLLRNQQKAENPTQYEWRAAQSYPHLQLECALIDNTMQMAMRAAERRRNPNMQLDSEEVDKFKTYRDFLERLREGRYVEFWTLKALREKDKRGLDQMTADGWMITDAIRFQINTSLPKDAENVVWLTHSKRSISTEHQRLLQELEKFDHVLDAMTYIRLAHPNKPENAIYAQVLEYRNSKELMERVKREQRKLDMAQKLLQDDSALRQAMAESAAIDGDEAMDVDDAHRQDVLNAHSLIEAFNTIQQFTEVLRFIGYSDRIIYWTQQVCTRQVVDRNVARLSVAPDKRDANGSGGSTLGGGGVRTNNGGTKRTNTTFGSSSSSSSSAPPLVVPSRKVTPIVGSDEDDDSRHTDKRAATTTDAAASSPARPATMEIDTSFIPQRVTSAPRPAIRLNPLPSNR